MIAADTPVQRSADSKLLYVDAAGRIHIIEVNPLPGLTPDWSDLVLLGSVSPVTGAAAPWTSRARPVKTLPSVSSMTCVFFMVCRVFSSMHI